MNDDTSPSYRVLTINAGSASVKFAVFDTASNTQLFKTTLDRVTAIEDAVRSIPRALEGAGIPAPHAVGHRVAHGGPTFRDACVIDERVVAAIEGCVPLAPLHNPPALAGIRAAAAAWPGVAQVAVFDTAFHQTMPDRAATYAVPQAWRDAGVRRYGFHGTSHKYVMQRVAEELRTPPGELRIISCHLGNGASVCAIERGVSVDTSMGMTPLEGLVMGTRCGDVDPGLVPHLVRALGLAPEQVEQALYHASGLAALSGAGNDMRDIERNAANGDRRAQLAIQVYVYRARKYIGAYAAAMSGVDVIAFTGGIGENSATMRRRICSGLEFLGLALDDERNEAVRLTGSEAPQIQRDTSRVRVLVTQTREQWMIALETARVLAPRPALTQTDSAIPVAVSAHHVHLTSAAVEALFGQGYALRIRNRLSQPGTWAAEETVDVIGPAGALQRLRVLGPCRAANQVEIAQTEAYKLGLDVPLRLSGDTRATPEVTLRGPKGDLRTNGLIVAKRHIHMSPHDALVHGLKHGDAVEVAIASDGRDLVFGDVVIRVDPQFVAEMHIDTDEANAAHLTASSEGELVRIEGCNARVTRCHRPATHSQSCSLREAAQIPDRIARNR